MAEDDHAIVVGITHYPGFSNLKGSENDARAFEKWLRSPSGGDVPEHNIKLILSSQFRRMSNPAKAKPTAEALTKAIDNLHDIGLKGGSHVGRRLYLFLAGHGIAREIHEAALLMANAAKGRTGHKIPGEPYADWFKESAFFDEVVLFMDCCLEDNKLSPPGGCHLDPISGGKKRARSYYALAAELGQSAEERTDKDGKMRGVFTSALLAGLRQGPPDGGDVTGKWLEDFVPQYMTKLLGGPDIQDPQFFYQRNKDIVFIERAKASVQAPVHAGPPHLLPGRGQAGPGQAVEQRAEAGLQVDIHTSREDRGKAVEQRAEETFRFRIHTGPEGRGQVVEMRDGSLNMVPPSSRSNETWEWELGPGLYAYCYADGEVHFRQLMGEGEEIDVQL